MAADMPTAPTSWSRPRRHGCTHGRARSRYCRTSVDDIRHGIRLSSHGLQRRSQESCRPQTKVALITGGAQGLGKAIAVAMANEGANIVICDINAQTLPGAASEIERAGARCVGIRCDVSSTQSVANLFRETVATFGTLDILVNNAALVQSGPRNEEMRSKWYNLMTTPMRKESLGVTKEFTDEEWHKYWDVNVHGVFYCTREALRIMEPKQSGKIINIASIAGIGGFSAFHPAYCATKSVMLVERRGRVTDVDSGQPATGGTRSSMEGGSLRAVARAG
jgi:NAD(P)-dependent dehydrogenase (short-subunit alcohol dehydrogenase family)